MGGYDGKKQRPEDKNGIPRLRQVNHYAKKTKKVAGAHPGFNRVSAPRFTKKLWDREEGRCWYCGKILPLLVATIDHQMPELLGGKKTLANCVCCCRHCNLAKGSLTVAYFRLLVADHYYRFWGERPENQERRRKHDEGQEDGVQDDQEAAQEGEAEVPGDAGSGEPDYGGVTESPG